MAGSTQDIHEQKTAEAALLSNNLLLDESQAVAKVGGWELNLKTGVLFWTDQTYRIHETSPEKFNPTVDAGVDLFLPESKRMISEALEAAMSRGEGYDLELETYTTQGNLIDVRTTCSVTMEGGKAVKLSGIFQDITERKRYERELQAARKEAESAAQSKGQFLANMSHEIRTPMNAILGLLNLLQSTELTDRQRDYASKTEGAAQSLLGLLNDILDFSKVEAGKMTLEDEPFRLDKLLRNLSVVLSANVGNKNIEVLFDIDASLPAVVRGDAMRLQQVLVNLGGNAVKFTSTGQVILAMRNLAKSENAVTIEFVVQDTGIGIAAEHQAHIFSGFSQAEGSTTRLFGGTGLGLAISKRFVELMGGDIQIHSQPGVGSTFSFALEMPTVDAATEAVAAPERLALTPQHVLVVDDNPVAGDLTLRIVRSWGWTAELARSGKEAIDRVLAGCAKDPSEFPYPVIYMDWKMPDMDGWETTRQIRQQARNSSLPQPMVVMITAHGREMLSQRTEDEQEMINGFLVKPVTASMLLDALMDAGSGNSGMRKVAKGRSSARQLAGMRILVVEDNLINQQVADELLTAEGAIVSLASNGQLGVDAVAAAAPQFDVVLMDVQMPVLDGYGATRAIREDLALVDLPIVAMTANAMASDREACLAAGMNEHIGKPFDMAKLVSLLIRMTAFEPDISLEGIRNTLPDPALPLPVVPGMDIQTALNRMSGMRSLYVRTARDFIKIMDTVIPELQHCLTSGDHKKAVMRLHTLKGNAGTLGADDLATQAARLEKLCATGLGMKECEEGLEQLEFLVRSTQQKMRDAISLLDTPAAPKGAGVFTEATRTVSSAALEALRHIADLAKSSDMEVLQEFAQVRELMAEFPAGFIDSLEDALQSLDLDAAGARCEEMLMQLSSADPAPQ
jgi:signal transduction histidine kinase/CheY-like chemotaxis protein